MRVCSAEPVTGSGLMASESTSGMFMPLMTVTRPFLSMSSTIELLTLLPSMSVHTYTASSGAKPSMSFSTSLVMGSLSSRAKETTWTLDTLPRTISSVSRAPAASPPCDARMI